VLTAFYRDGVQQFHLVRVCLAPAYDSQKKPQKVHPVARLECYQLQAIFAQSSARSQIAQNSAKIADAHRQYLRNLFHARLFAPMRPERCLEERKRVRCPNAQPLQHIEGITESLLEPRIKMGDKKRVRAYSCGHGKIARLLGVLRVSIINAPHGNPRGDCAKQQANRLGRRRTQAQIRGQRIRRAQRHNPQRSRRPNQALQYLVNSAIAPASQNRIASPADSLHSLRPRATRRSCLQRLNLDTRAAQHTQDIVDNGLPRSRALAGCRVVHQCNTTHGNARLDRSCASARRSFTAYDPIHSCQCFHKIPFLLIVCARRA